MPPKSNREATLVSQAWPVEDAAVVLEVRSDKPLSGSAIATLNAIIDAIEKVRTNPSKPRVEGIRFASEARNG